MSNFSLSKTYLKQKIKVLFYDFFFIGNTLTGTLAQLFIYINYSLQDIYKDLKIVQIFRGDCTPEKDNSVLFKNCFNIGL